MLQVKAFPRTRTRSTEHSFEKRFAAILKEMGFYSRHMSDHNAGVPDRYVQRGQWIEFKSLFKKRGLFALGEGLTPEQHRTMKDLNNAGDDVYYCALLDTGYGEKNVILMPYWRTDSPDSNYHPGDAPNWLNEYIFPNDKESIERAIGRTLHE